MAEGSKEKQAEEWNNRGLYLANTGKISEAITCYDRAIELNPNLSVPWNNKGYEFSRLGKHNEAIRGRHLGK